MLDTVFSQLSGAPTPNRSKIGIFANLESELIVIHYSTPMISDKTILNAIPHVLKTINLPGLGKKHQGKVRDFYIIKDKRVIITTDRQSSFNYIIGHVPFKGAVLNQLAAFWFAKTKKIVENHVISIPHPNVLIAKNCTPIPIEMVVRGYLTGVTVTSPWGNYQKGERTIYGITFPDGLTKNQKLPTPIITPTGHPDPESGSHEDERLTKEEILKRKIVPKKIYLQMEEISLKLFDLGSKWCKKHGLILVDTKYEFGMYKGKLVLYDEVHTPDSSRFWLEKSYLSRIKKGLEPENFDKEFLRLYYIDKLGYKGTGKPPTIPEELAVDLAKRYIAVYEKISGKKFKEFEYPIEQRIRAALQKL